MRIYRHHESVAAAHRGAVVALGNFDGVHRGHQALIGEARRLSQEQKVPLGVIAFEPHPQEFFRPSDTSFRLTPLRTKARLIADLDVDALFALNFDAAMAEKSAEDFVRDILVAGLGVSAIVVGKDFRFGKGRLGDVQQLGAMGAQFGFQVIVFEPVTFEPYGKISSSDIREALQQGRPDEAARLLGHFWTVEARVEHGDARGRLIGFPTANMRIEDFLRPAYGVYAVRARLVENDQVIGCYDGVANFGVRPMYQIAMPLLETFLFDFSDDLYGKHLAVDLIHYIRPEAMLEGLEALKDQIARDCDAARAALAAL